MAPLLHPFYIDNFQGWAFLYCMDWCFQGVSPALLCELILKRAGSPLNLLVDAFKELISYLIIIQPPWSVSARCAALITSRFCLPVTPKYTWRGANITKTQQYRILKSLHCIQLQITFILTSDGWWYKTICTIYYDFLSNIVWAIPFFFAPCLKPMTSAFLSFVQQ